MGDSRVRTGSWDGMCFVCNGSMTPYFMKDFHGQWGLRVVEYWICNACGMVVSKTHIEMLPGEWEELNSCYHASLVQSDEPADDPRWLLRLRAQADVMATLVKAKVLSTDLPWVDYACGDGRLAGYLSEYGLSPFKFERYMISSDKGYLTEEELVSTKYDAVINTSMFEHVRSLSPLDEIAALVASSGVLALHVLVRETIPRDPTWFYLLPVHCSFFTNKSMQILFDRWGFEASIYHLESRMWFWFKKDTGKAKTFVQQEESISSGRFYYKKGFMDYWKP